nr:MAG TPA: hypothetical protein [Caudoviricetes sp.]
MVINPNSPISFCLCKYINNFSLNNNMFFLSLFCTYLR